MSEVYVFAQDNEDWATIGECGALEPTSCLFEEIANGDSELTLEHPLDALGKYRYLQPGAVLKAEVPVRATPEIEDGRFVTSVEKWTVKKTVTKAESYIYSKASGGKKKKRLGGGTTVIVVSKPTSGRWKVKYSKTTGYMDANALESQVTVTIPDTPDGMESVLPSWELREQLFRIYRITREDTVITASARHISYDLMYNLTTYQTDGEVQLQTALDGVLTQCVDPHDFTAATDIQGGRVGVHTRDLNPIEAILDPEEGLAARWGAQLVRDDYELYLLSKAGANRGMTIEFARNLTGVDVDEDLSNVATCIRPVGENKNGTPLYLSGNGCIDSPLVNNYPFRRVHLLKCDNCKVGTNGVTAAIAQARMREQAQALFASGIDLPSVSAKVTFALLGHSARYAQYRELESVYLYDEIRVRHPRLGVDLTTQVVRTVWDCLRERMTNIELGSLQALTPSVAKWQVPSGISGTKIAQGTVGSAALANDVISARHMQAESINADAIQADAVTTDKLAANSVTADKLAAGAISADTIKTVTLEAMVAWLRTVTAESITTDELAAQFARLQTIVAGTATFDRATIQQLVAEAMHLTFGEMGQVFIDNLMVNYAQMVSAAIGDLVVKASDGNYYHLDVAQDGSVTATKTTVTEGEINAGQTGDGKVILETDITASNLSTSNLFATFALVNRIDAARIDVDELFAREAFITLLRTSHIVGEKSLEIVVRDTEAAQKAAEEAIKSVDVEYYLSDSPTELSGGSWSADAPEWAEGKYIWSRTVTTSNAGAVNTSEPSCITGNTGATGPAGADGATGPAGKDGAPGQDGAPGANGKDGAAGVGVSAIVEEYYLSTSRTEQTGGGWSTSQPAWVDGCYLWTRSRITWTDGNTTTTAPVLAEAINAANNVKVGGRNYLIGTATPKTANYNTPQHNPTNNFQCSDPYSTYEKRTLENLGFKVGDKVSLGFDWEISKNGSLDYLYGFFQAEFLGITAAGADNTYVGTINGRVATFSATNTRGHATMTCTLNASMLGAHTLRLRVDQSVLALTISNCKLESGDKCTDWSPAPEDVDAQIDSAAESLSGQIGDVSSRVDDCVTHTEQAVYLRQVAGKGVYVGFEGGSAEAFIDASGWFRVLHNGVSITSLGPRIQELGTLQIYETADGGHAFL